MKVQLRCSIRFLAGLSLLLISEQTVCVRKSGEQKSFGFTKEMFGFGYLGRVKCLQPGSSEITFVTVISYVISTVVHRARGRKGSQVQQAGTRRTELDDAEGISVLACH